MGLSTFLVSNCHVSRNCFHALIWLFPGSPRTILCNRDRTRTRHLMRSPWASFWAGLGPSIALGRSLPCIWAFGSLCLSSGLCTTQTATCSSGSPGLPSSSSESYSVSRCGTVGAWLLSMHLPSSSAGTMTSILWIWGSNVNDNATKRSNAAILVFF